MGAAGDRHGAPLRGRDLVQCGSDKGHEAACRCEGADCFRFMTGLSSEVPVRLLCDEMLARLGRWLRAAGYDTEIAAGGMPDRALLARCAAEGRVLLTRDRHLAAIAVARGVRVLRLSESSIEAQARTPRQEHGIDWQRA